LVERAAAQQHRGIYCFIAAKHRHVRNKVFPSAALAFLAPGISAIGCGKAHARLGCPWGGTYRRGADPQALPRGEAGKTNVPSGRRRAAGVKVARSICPGPRMWNTLSPAAIR